MVLVGGVPKVVFLISVITGWTTASGRSVHFLHGGTLKHLCLLYYISRLFIPTYCGCSRPRRFSIKDQGVK